ncbi:MAG: ABC transporter ATP-binding protein [Oscillospiraceae bacterium]|nr:ABC transporter ATP-binding protein [Oscillospiraceae bacterium]MCD8346290.1 ABC transporter ATP-binding protein [Oscillospiraceae bacterium]
MNTVIELKHISKSFGGKQIYRDVNLKVNAGECIGFAGRNGAGKSVLFQLMVGLLPPDRGEVWLGGKLLGSGGEDFPKDVGILINETGFIGYLSGFQNLKMLAQIRNIVDDETIRETMRSVGLDDADRTPVRKYSMGMKQKLGIAQAIMENQSIVILDEPYNALDFEANREVTQILERLKGQGKTILLTSHQHQYLEKLCDKIYFICDGAIVPFTEEIRAQYFSV